MTRNLSVLSKVSSLAIFIKAVDMGSSRPWSFRPIIGG